MFAHPAIRARLADASASGQTRAVPRRAPDVTQEELIAALPARLRAAVLLLTRHGLRVSEAVGLRASDVVDGQRLRVRLSKGNGPRVLRDAEIVGLLGGPGQQPETRALVPYTARAVRGTMERLGYAYRPPGATNRRVSHAGRARVMQSLDAQGLSHQQIAERMRLDDARTVRHYLDTPPAGS